MALLLDDAESRGRLLAYANERLKAHRAQLEAPEIDTRKADTLRGRIAELKFLLSDITNGAANE